SPTVIYPLSLHDALPISSTASIPDDVVQGKLSQQTRVIIDGGYFGPNGTLAAASFQGNVIVQDQNNPSTSRQLNTLMSTVQINRSEEHTSELQSPCNLVC